MDDVVQTTLQTAVRALFDPVTYVCFSGLVLGPKTDTHLSVMLHLPIRTVRKSLATLHRHQLVSMLATDSRHQPLHRVNPKGGIQDLRQRWARMRELAIAERQSASDGREEHWMCGACSHRLDIMDVMTMLREGAAPECPVCGSDDVREGRADTVDHDATLKELDAFGRMLEDAWASLTESDS